MITAIVKGKKTQIGSIFPADYLRNAKGAGAVAVKNGGLITVVALYKDKEEAKHYARKRDIIGVIDDNGRPVFN